MILRGLAASAKVDATWLSKVERSIYHAPDARYLYRLARALDIETADLYLEAGYGDGRGLPQCSCGQATSFGTWRAGPEVAEKIGLSTRISTMTAEHLRRRGRACR